MTIMSRRLARIYKLSPAKTYDIAVDKISNTFSFLLIDYI
jgi:hypothetical protein